MVTEPKRPLRQAASCWMSCRLVLLSSRRSFPAWLEPLWRLELSHQKLACEWVRAGCLGPPSLLGSQACWLSGTPVEGWIVSD